MCSLEKRGKVYILTLVGDDNHRFNATTVHAISAALKQVEQSPDATALVTTNASRFFLQWPQLAMAFMKLGISTVAAICGHAAVGGFMLALAHDYRFMTQGCSMLYMSKLDHGMHLPRGMMSIIRSKLQTTTLHDVVLGALF